MKIEIAVFNARKYSTFALAADVALAQRYPVPVLLGCDGRFWVPSNGREASLLIRSGYERA